MPAQGSPAESDAEWVLRVRELQRGSAPESVFASLFRELYPWTCGLFRRRGLSPADAEDLAQETLVRAFREIGTLRRPELFRAWLRSIAGNVLRNEWRHRSRLKRAASEVALESPGEGGGPTIEVREAGPAPDEMLLAKERRRRLREALAGLAPQMRQCLLLRLEQDLKYREIAAVLKISIETVKAHLAQGKKRLKTELAAELEEKL